MVYVDLNSHTEVSIQDSFWRQLIGEFESVVQDFVDSSRVEWYASQPEETWMRFVERELASLFNLVWVERGYGAKCIVARECKLCGSPVGAHNPDECRWVVLVTCRGCYC